jgi:hypothetical protein
VPAKSTWLEGQKGPKHMAAGLAKTALMASWGAAMPTPPMALEIGPTPIRLSPLVAIAGADNKTVKNKTRIILQNDFIFFSSKKI